MGTQTRFLSYFNQKWIHFGHNLNTHLLIILKQLLLDFCMFSSSQTPLISFARHISIYDTNTSISLLHKHLPRLQCVNFNNHVSYSTFSVTNTLQLIPHVSADYEFRNYDIAFASVFFLFPVSVSLANEKLK